MAGWRSELTCVGVSIGFDVVVVYVVVVVNPSVACGSHHGRVPLHLSHVGREVGAPGTSFSLSLLRTERSLIT